MTVPILPLTLTDGAFATVPQGSLRDRQQRIAGILNTPRGDLDHNPEFGRTASELTSAGADIDQVRGDILAIEPDLTFDVIDAPAVRTPGAVTDNVSIQLPEDA